VKGAALRYRDRGRHIITGAIEHASVYESCRQLESFGYDVTYLRPDETGLIRPEQIKAAIKDDTILVSLMHVNNEMGRIEPIQEMGRLLAGYPRILFHTDAVQSFGKLPVVPSELGVDLLSVSAHKFRGPKGAGFLYKRESVELSPLLTGGGQEGGYRSGTENVPLIVGMAKAVRIAAERREVDSAKLYELRRLVIERLDAIDGIVVNGSSDPVDMAPQLVHFSMPGMKPEAVVHALEQDGICISTRSACASGEEKPSRVLTVMGLDKERAASGLRVSYSAEISEDDIRCFTESLEKIAASFGKLRRS
jgi:cysteine desulfurase